VLSAALLPSVEPASLLLRNQERSQPTFCTHPNNTHNPQPCCEIPHKSQAGEA
jgi:hypothetical protein